MELCIMSTKTKSAEHRATYNGDECRRLSDARVTHFTLFVSSRQSKCPFRIHRTLNSFRTGFCFDSLNRCRVSSSSAAFDKHRIDWHFSKQKMSAWFRSSRFLFELYGKYIGVNGTRSGSFCGIFLLFSFFIFIWIRFLWNAQFFPFDFIILSFVWLVKMKPNFLLVCFYRMLHVRA